MSKFYFDQLVTLIGSMTKAEKRHFKLYSQRHFNQARNLDYLRVFDLIDQKGITDKQALSKQLPDISAKRLSELKTNLYQRILQSLRPLYGKDPELYLRELIDHAHILYRKGLFMQSLAILERAKTKAWENEAHFLVLETIEFEKRIEARHVTRSHSERAVQLTEETQMARRIIFRETAWSDLALELYSKYLQIGHVKSQEEHQQMVAFFEAKRETLPRTAPKTFYEALYRAQSLVWYCYITQEFKRGYRYASEWIELFNQYPRFVQLERKQVLKGFHNCLSILFYCLDSQRYTYYKARLEQFIQENEDHFDQNTRMMAFAYQRMAELNAVILEARFSASRPLLEQLDEELLALEDQMDSHRLMVFWYKIGSIYFSMGDHKRCIHFLNRIINPNLKYLREDVQCFARILNLVAHFELGNDEFIAYQVRSVYHFLGNMKDLQELQKQILQFLRANAQQERNELRPAFKVLLEKLHEIRQDPYQNRPFLYLDIISWLESWIQNRKVEDIIREKREAEQMGRVRA